MYVKIVNCTNFYNYSVPELNVSFESETYFVNEDGGFVELCLTTDKRYGGKFDAAIEAVMKEIDNAATGMTL